MRRSLRGAFLVLPATILFAATAPAHADIRIEPVDGTSHKIVLSGQIDVTTLMDFSQALADERIAGSASRLVDLESPGGSLSSAMAIGVLIRKGGFSTAVAAKGKCYSACVLVLAAGVHRTVASGKVGIHRPYLDMGLHTPDSRGRMSEDIGEVTDGINHYLADMGVRNELVELMMKVPSQFMRQLTVREVATLGLDTSKPCEWVEVASVEPTAAPEAEEAATIIKSKKVAAAKKPASRKASASARKSKEKRVARRPQRYERQALNLTGSWERAAPTPARFERKRSGKQSWTEASHKQYRR